MDKMLKDFVDVKARKTSFT